MRYVNLSLTMVFRVLSSRVKERFPMMSDLVDAGLLTKNELNIIEDLDEKFPGYGKNWIPIVWAATLVNRARHEGRIGDDFSAKIIIEALNDFRGSCGLLMFYNSISIPLVYTQVVSIAVYFFFIAKLFSQQFDTDENNIIQYDTLNYFPIMVVMEFIFYMGWLKVAETMINPFGEDDDDFEIHQIVDRNIQISYMIVDHMHNEHPELLKGEKWLNWNSCKLAFNRCKLLHYDSSFLSTDQYWNAIPRSLPDRGRDDSNQKKPLTETDIFDFDVKDSVMRRVTISKIISDDNFDVEAAKTRPGKISKVADMNDALVPSASVIDKTYQRMADVDIKQSFLIRQMQKVMQESDSDTSDLSRFESGRVSVISRAQSNRDLRKK